MTRARLAALALALACVTPSTGLVVVVDTDLDVAGGAFDVVRATVRDGGATGALRGAQDFRVGPGRLALPLSFGVAAREGGTRALVHVEVRACRGACGVDALAAASATVAFAPEETRALRLTLSARCRYVRCPQGATCDPATGACVDARREATDAPAAPAPSLAAGVGQTCLARVDGALVCWGDRVPGRSAPAGPDDRAPPALRADLRGVAGVSLGDALACARTATGGARCWTHEGARDVVTRDGAALSDVDDVGAGWDGACARTRDGAVWCWGGNAHGQLGDGTTRARAEAARVALPARAAQLSVGFDRACAVLYDGAVWCWGRAVGAAPARLTAVPSAAEVRVGWRHACARDLGGRVRCWGDNSAGQLGRGDLAPRDDAGLVRDLDGVVALTARAFHTCALRDDGTARCWGRNDLGQLGDGTTAPRAIPVVVRADGGELRGVRALAAGGDHTCALVAGGGVRCWGGDLHGELGAGRLLARAAAQPLGLARVEALSAQPGGACAVRDGVVQCWGARDPGWSPGAQGSSAQERLRVMETAAAVQGLASPTREVTLGRWHSCLLAADGAVTCWGSNDRGQLGPDVNGDAPTPGRAALASALGVSAGAWHSCARVAGDRVRCWGGNDVGQLGDGTRQDRARPDVLPLEGVAEVASGERASCARTHAGEVWCWGALDDAAESRAAAPVRVALAGPAVAVTAGRAHACAALRDGTAACWGANASGQRGDGTTRDGAARAVLGLRGVRELRAGGDTTCARLDDGGVRCWGEGELGQLGDGARVDRATPTPVPGIRSARALAVGRDVACAATADGRAWCWGDAERGALGAGARDATTGPVLVRDATGEAIGGVTGVAAGEARACAWGPRGTWCWGAGDHGELGDGVWREVPRVLEVRGLEGEARPLVGLRAVAAGARHACAALDDGRVACWGSNGDGRLGDGTRVDRATPTLARTGAARAVELAAGDAHTCLRTAEGAVWCWGANRAGQLGVAGSGSRATPERVPLAAAAEELRAGGDTTCARGAGGAVWCWGANDHGQLGRGDRAARAGIEPVRADGTRLPVTGASRIAVGRRHACALVGARVVCWGDDRAGAVSGAAGAAGGAVTLARAVSGVELPSVLPGPTLGAGEALSCLSGVLGYPTVCWGSNAEGEVNPAAPRGAVAPTEVSGRAPNSRLLAYGAGRGFLCTTSEFLEGVRCAGVNEYGQRGLGTRALHPVALLTLDPLPTDAVTAGEDFACAHGARVALRCWGRNEAGQLGVGAVDGSARASPLRAPLATRRVVGGASHRCALLDDGTVRCWGDGGLGQLGDGAASARERPVTVPGLEGATALSAGFDHTCAVYGDAGLVRCWGRNDRFQLGDTVTTPTRQADARGVLGAARVAAGEGHACAALRDGRVACWGDRGDGQTGDGDPAPDAAPPRLVRGLASVRDLAAGARHTCAVDADGVTSCWGANTSGQLGDGGRAASGRPARVRVDVNTPLRDAVAVAASRDRRCARVDDGALRCEAAGTDFACALLRDGAVWCWGEGDRGQLGDGDRASRPWARAVLGVAGATALEVGARHACASTPEGWRCWGDNREGALTPEEPVLRAEAAAVALP